MVRFEEFVESTRDVETSEELKALYLEAVQEEGYENVLLTSVVGTNVTELHWLRFPDGYPEHYFEQHWDQIDPIFKCALRSRRPFLWSAVFESIKLSKRQQVLMEECKNLGVHSGILFPLHGPGNKLDILSISRRGMEGGNPDRLHLLHSISIQAWTRFLELTEKERFQKPEGPILTAREVEVLKWCKDGKSYSDIGEILSVSRKTVEFHVANAMNKLGANNKVTAVVIAIQLGLLDL